MKDQIANDHFTKADNPNVTRIDSTDSFLTKANIMIQYKHAG